MCPDRASAAALMAAVDVPADPRPWHALARAPLAHVAAFCRAAAEVLNLPASGTRSSSRIGQAAP